MYTRLNLLFLMPISIAFLLSAGDATPVALTVCNKTYSHMLLEYTKERRNEYGDVVRYQACEHISRAGGQATLKIITPHIVARFVECGKKGRFELTDAGRLDKGRLDISLCLTKEYAIQPNPPCLLAPEAYGGAWARAYNAHGLFTDLIPTSLEDIIHPETGKRHVVSFLESMDA